VRRKIQVAPHVTRPSRRTAPAAPPLVAAPRGPPPEPPPRPRLGSTPAAGAAARAGAPVDAAQIDSDALGSTADPPEALIDHGHSHPVADVPWRPSAALLRSGRRPSRSCLRSERNEPPQGDTLHACGCGREPRGWPVGPPTTCGCTSPVPGSCDTTAHICRVHPRAGLGVGGEAGLPASWAVPTVPVWPAPAVDET
jgi:hypothetical protein